MGADDDGEFPADETSTLRVDLATWKPTGEPTLELMVPQRRVISLSQGSTILGRAPGRGIALNYPGVSREHAQVIRSGDRATSLMDLESKNGTIVNGEQVRIRTLEDGDRILLGPHVELRFGYMISVERDGVSLTPREREVASLVAAGLTNKLIAKRLGVTPHAVDAVLRTAFSRTGVRSRAALVGWLNRNDPA